MLAMTMIKIRFLYRQPQGGKVKDPAHQDFDAKWEEYRLVAEGKDPRGNKYERS
jgi:hypothetical protein